LINKAHSNIRDLGATIEFLRDMPKSLKWSVRRLETVTGDNKILAKVYKCLEYN
jgi:hypothetical protein